MIKRFRSTLAGRTLDAVCVVVSDSDLLRERRWFGRSDGWQDPQRILETGPRSHLGPSSLFTISSKRQSSLCILRGCSLKTERFPRLRVLWMVEYVLIPVQGTVGRRAGSGRSTPFPGGRRPQAGRDFPSSLASPRFWFLCNHIGSGTSPGRGKPSLGEGAGGVARPGVCVRGGMWQDARPPPGPPSRAQGRTCLSSRARPPHPGSFLGLCQARVPSAHRPFPEQSVLLRELRPPVDAPHPLHRGLGSAHPGAAWSLKRPG